MEICEKCGRSEEETRLFDGIYVNETIRICERCSLLESIPILKVPSTNQLKNSERTNAVYKRLTKISGLEGPQREKSVFEELQELEENPNLEKPDEEPLRLVENYHWVIKAQRRRKGLSHKQLADMIGESEMAIKLIERKNLPEDALPVVKKLQQYFRVRLIRLSRDEELRRKRQESEKKLKQEVDKSFEDSYEEILFGETKVDNSKAEVVKQELEEGASPLGDRKEPLFKQISPRQKYLEKIREKEADDMVREAIKTEPPEIKKHEVLAGEPMKVLNFKKEKLNEITISDLQSMQKVIEEDFPTKTSEEIGKEQLEDFGKGEESVSPKIAKKKWFNRYVEKKEHKVEKINSGQGLDSGKVPTLYELAEKKKAKEGVGEVLTGDDIEIAEDKDLLGELDL